MFPQSSSTRLQLQKTATIYLLYPKSNQTIIKGAHEQLRWPKVVLHGLLQAQLHVT